jgi:hypothetical protein
MLSRWIRSGVGALLHPLRTPRLLDQLTVEREILIERVIELARERDLVARQRDQVTRAWRESTQLLRAATAKLEARRGRYVASDTIGRTVGRA